MADQKVGGVYYEVAADTSDVIQMGAVVDKTTSAIQNDFKQTDKVINQASSGIQTSMTKTAAAVQKTQSSFGGLRSVAGNLGFQLQDIAVQAQSGASAFVILGQQGSQVASAFGPGGAVLGAVIAISAAIGGTLVAALGKAEEKLKKLPEDLQARLDAIRTQLEQEGAIAPAIAEVETGKITTEIAGITEEIRRLTAQNEQLRLVQEKTSDPRTLQQYKQQIAINNGLISDGNARIRELGTLQERVITSAVEFGGEFEKIEENITSTVDKQKQLVEQLTVANTKTVEGELAARKLAAAYYLGLTNAEMLPPVIDRLIEKTYKAEQAQKALAESAKEAEKSLLAELGADEQQRRTVTTEFQQVATSAATDLESPAQRAERELAERLAVINRYAQQEYADKEAALQAQFDAEQAYSEKVKAIKQAEDDFRNKQNMNTLSTVGDFFGNLASIAEKGGEKQFKAWKLLASAQAGISAALAVLNVLANPNIPYPLNIGLAGSIAALAGAQVAQIQSAQYSGGRMYGGPVSPGNVYQVGENNSPELLRQGNKQYLIPGNRGSVTSNADMMGGGGVNVSVNVQNYSGQPVDVQRGQTGSGTNAQEVINIVVGNINQRGQIHQSIVRSTTAGNRTT